MGVARKLRKANVKPTRQFVHESPQRLSLLCGLWYLVVLDLDEESRREKGLSEKEVGSKQENGIVAAAKPQLSQVSVYISNIMLSILKQYISNRLPTSEDHRPHFLWRLQVQLQLEAPMSRSRESSQELLVGRSNIFAIWSFSSSSVSLVTCLWCIS